MREKVIKITALNPFEGNPQERTPEDIEQLVAAIKLDGFIDQVCVWGNAPDYNYPKNTILGGHGRVEALQVIIETEGMEYLNTIEGIENGAVACRVLDKDEAGAKRVLVALNSIGGSFNNILLKDIIVDIDTGDFELAAIGFEQEEINDLFDGDLLKYNTSLGELADKTTAVCPKCGNEFELTV